jgi:hypothetical protein
MFRGSRRFVKPVDDRVADERLSFSPIPAGAKISLRAGLSPRQERTRCAACLARSVNRAEVIGVARCFRQRPHAPPDVTRTTRLGDPPWTGRLRKTV